METSSEELRRLYAQAQQEIAERARVEIELRQRCNKLEELAEARGAEIVRIEAQLTQEVVERRRVEEALRAGEARYRLLADTTPLPVIVVDLDGIILYANQRAAGLFEMPWDRAIGQYMPDFYVDPQHRTQYLERLRQHGHVVDYEMLLESASGRKFWAFISALLTTFEGRPAIFAAFNDITERRQMEEELRRRAAQLEEANRESQEARLVAEAANRAKSGFLANMSHELRTPLNAILGFSEMMAQDPALAAAQRENLATINRSGEHLLQLINDILDMARIEVGHVTVQAQPLNLHHLLDGLVELFRPRAADKGLSFDVEQAPDLPRYIVSDERKVRQILVNLLSNAVKFTGSGGITLRVWADRAGEEVRASAMDLVCEVQDTGPGIVPVDHELVFKPFEQLSRRGEPQGGTGLGLPISRQFARLLGGDLDLVSTGIPGQGALFRLHIPITLAGEPDTATGFNPVRARAVGLEPGQPAYRLLVAEDQPENRSLLDTLLRGLGFAVQAVGDGQEALQLWEEWQPHLILLDMIMPKVDGYEVTRCIKATQRGRATIVVALTASVREEDRSRGRAAGCDDFLRKPFHQHEIVDMLARHLGVRFRYTGPAREPVAPDALEPPAAVSSMGQHDLDLAGLPADWVARLRQAAIEADGTQIAALAEEAREARPALAAALQRLVENFDYQTILTAIATGGECP